MKVLKGHRPAGVARPSDPPPCAPRVVRSLATLALLAWGAAGAGPAAGEPAVASGVRARYGVPVLTDVPLDQLRAYRGVQVAPDDFDAFWEATLAGSRSLAAPPVLEPVET